MQINVAIAASEPSRLYATVSTTKPSDYASGKGLGVYRSDEAGKTGRKITDDPRPAMKIGGGDLPIPGVDPKNPDVVYSASIVTCARPTAAKHGRASAARPAATTIRTSGSIRDNPNIILLVSDQGALVSVNGGETWSSWYNQPTAQLYHVAATNDFPYQVCAGQQESGSVCISSRGNDGEITFREWHPVGVIEYGYVAPDPLDPDIVYGAGRTEVSRYHWMHRAGAERHADPDARGDYRARPHRADCVFAGRSAHALLRGERAVQNNRRRAILADRSVPT